MFWTNSRRYDCTYIRVQTYAFVTDIGLDIYIVPKTSYEIISDFSIRYIAVTLSKFSFRGVRI